MRKAVTVSIVSHGHLELIRPLLAQLDTHCHELIAKLVLTINVPEPDAIAGLEWRFPIEKIENPTPMGFGANQNQAFRHCETPWFLVLNPDIRLDEDVLTPLIAQAAPQAGLLTPRIYEPGQYEPEQHRGLLTPLEILTRRRPEYARPSHPAWIPGMFMLFRQQTFFQIHGFDERFFMYGEDFDICARAQLAGWQIQVCNDLSVVHEAQRASRRNYRHMWWHLLSLSKVWCSSSFWRLRKRLESLSTPRT